MHLDGMKQEEVEKSNLLGTVVVVCPAFVRKQEEITFHIMDSLIFFFFLRSFKKLRTIDQVNVSYEFYWQQES